MRIPWPTGRAEDILQRAVLLVLSVALAGLIGLAIVAFISSQNTAHQALATRDQTAASASRRIDTLQARITRLQAELELAKSQRGELIAKVDALGMQISTLGARPIASSGSSGEVTTPRATAPTPATTTTTTPQAPGPEPQPSPPTTTPPPSPPPTAPPPECTGIKVAGICIGS